MPISELKKNRFIQLFTVGLRYLIGAGFVFASIVKIKGERFTTSSGEFEAINSWLHYFETMYQSGMYWEAIGWMQLLAGFFLMTQRFATLGNLLFFPTILNILLVTISYNFKGTFYVTYMMTLASVYLFIWDWNKLKVFLNLEAINDDPEFMKRSIWAYFGLFGFALAIFIEWLTKVKGREFENPLLPFFLLLSLFGITVLTFLIFSYRELRRSS